MANLNLGFDMHNILCILPSLPNCLELSGESSSMEKFPVSHHSQLQSIKQMFEGSADDLPSELALFQDLEMSPSEESELKPPENPEMALGLEQLIAPPSRKLPTPRLELPAELDGFTSFGLMPSSWVSKDCYQDYVHQSYHRNNKESSLRTTHSQDNYYSGNQTLFSDHNSQEYVSPVVFEAQSPEESSN